MAVRRISLWVAFVALLAASCAADDGTGTPPATGGSLPESVVDADDVVAPGDQTAVVNECAAEQDGRAADTFDEAGLDLDPDGVRRFVPLDDPEMVTAAEVTWLDPDDIVMGILHESGEAQAFPIDQMTYHHVANTTVAGEPYLVTY